MSRTYLVDGLYVELFFNLLLNREKHEFAQILNFVQFLREQVLDEMVFGEELLVGLQQPWEVLALK